MNTGAPAAPAPTTTAPTTAAPDTQAGVAPSTPTTSASDWTAGLSDDYRGFVQNKGFKDPTAVLESYRSLEKHLGVPKERLLKLPEKDDDPSWGEVYDRLGRPKDPTEYNLPEGGSKEFSDWAKGTFHQLGLSKKAAETLSTKWNEYMANGQKNINAEYEKVVTQDAANLKKEWGAGYDQQVSVAKQTCATFGIDADTLDNLDAVMGHSNTMKLLAKIGSRLGEDKFVGNSSNGGFNALTPEAARNKISMLRQDNEFVKRYTSGDTSAIDEMGRLHKYAYPEG